MISNFKYSIFLNILKLFIKQLFLKKRILIFKNLKNTRKVLYKLKIKKILITKLIKLKLEKLIYSSNNLKSVINIQNVFNIFSLKKELKVPKNATLWWNSRLFFFSDLINILFFSVFFRKSSIFASFIAKNITNKKMHFNFLKKIKRILNGFFYYGKYYNLVGILIKFQGILRKRKFKHIYGKSSMTTFTTFVDYSLQKSYTKFGVFSIKVYLFYSIINYDKK